jgi:hypothetical protein
MLEPVSISIFRQETRMERKHLLCQTLKKSQSLLLGPIILPLCFFLGNGDSIQNVVDIISITDTGRSLR